MLKLLYVPDAVAEVAGGIQAGQGRKGVGFLLLGPSLDDNAGSDDRPSGSHQAWWWGGCAKMDRGLN